jgi:hypothetical protein
MSGSATQASHKSAFLAGRRLPSLSLDKALTGQITSVSLGLLDRKSRVDVLDENHPSPNPTPNPSATPPPSLPLPLPQPLPAPASSPWQSQSPGFYTSLCGSDVGSLCVSGPTQAGSGVSVISPGISYPFIPSASATINYFVPATGSSATVVNFLNGPSLSISAGEGVIISYTCNSDGQAFGIGFGVGSPVSFTAGEGISSPLDSNDGPNYYPDSLASAVYRDNEIA